MCLSSVRHAVYIVLSFLIAISRNLRILLSFRDPFLCHWNFILEVFVAQNMYVSEDQVTPVPSLAELQESCCYWNYC